MAEGKKTEQAAEGQAQASGDSTPKTKKINVMTLKEIEAKLAEVMEKQGGLTSKYAKQLLLRKKSLFS
jgi:hypothetical protein